jgi:hypothetical protein
VESVVVGFLRTWIEERLRVAKECLVRSKDTEVNLLGCTFRPSIKHVHVHIHDLKKFPKPQNKIVHGILHCCVELDGKVEE